MKVRAVVLEGIGDIRLRDIEVPGTPQPADNEVRIAVKAVGICGSDVHYYKHGRIGDFVVNEPMILGHEAAGVVTAVGAKVADLKVGDRVCMEPGIPDFDIAANARGPLQPRSVGALLGDAADSRLLDAGGGPPGGADL